MLYSVIVVIYIDLSHTYMLLYCSELNCIYMYFYNFFIYALYYFFIYTILHFFTYSVFLSLVYSSVIYHSLYLRNFRILLVPCILDRRVRVAAVKVTWSRHMLARVLAKKLNDLLQLFFLCLIHKYT